MLDLGKRALHSLDQQFCSSTTLRGSQAVISPWELIFPAPDQVDVPPGPNQKAALAATGDGPSEMSEEEPPSLEYRHKGYDPLAAVLTWKAKKLK